MVIEIEGYNVCGEDRTKIRALFGLSDDEVKVKVEELKKWVQSNPHLPEESHDEAYLDIMLLRSKFKDDYVKKNIENYFKYMSKYPEVFKKLGKFKPSEEVGVAMASPTLAPNFERIGILKLLQKNMSSRKFDINQMILVTVTTGIIMYNNDYTPSIRFLLDFEGFTMLDLFKVNLRDLFKLVSICENILRIRISGFELLNAPRLMTALLGIGRVLLKPKMFSRITTHSDASTLLNNIPKECLPSDYGGESESTDTLVEIWDHIVEAQKPFFEKVANYSRKS
ncbi:hypothetical protein Zmor_017907 [Zophobas morio]|uniref:CRAL-TRIO domain-containing protein n=1 Tax=Zophobas morio TaxID=2755281 RepID=A0AA38IAI2_9CUCU|nr:hypothetical protein Zmor_017907 [Zophobas morio]